MAVNRVFPEEFGYHFTEQHFEEIYAQTLTLFKNQTSKEEFIKQSKKFHQGTERFELKFQNQLEPGVKRYAWVDEATGRMVITAFNTALEIVGIQFDIHERFDTDRDITVNAYHYPFDDNWLVLWGGPNKFMNYHYPHRHQRYAYDFIRTTNGMAHDGNREDLTSYFAYGKPVKAPRKGRVARILTGIPDNSPSRMNLEEPEGNAIIIEHGNNEYSLLAHLRDRSITVSVGDEVETHETIAQCGNSGASDTPHLHFHVMNDIEPHEADSIRIQFADGREPVQGNTVWGHEK